MNNATYLMPKDNEIVNNLNNPCKHQNLNLFVLGDVFINLQTRRMELVKIYECGNYMNQI